MYANLSLIRSPDLIQLDFSLLESSALQQQYWSVTYCVNVVTLSGTGTDETSLCLALLIETHSKVCTFSCFYSCFYLYVWNTIFLQMQYLCITIQNRKKNRDGNTKRKTSSQHHSINWIGRTCEIIESNSWPQATLPPRSCHKMPHLFLEHLQGWWQHHLTAQSIPIFNKGFCEEIPPGV